MTNGSITEWISCCFGDITTLVSSGRSKKFNQGEHVLYGSTGQIGWTNDLAVTTKAILVARVGANAGTVQYVKGQFGVTDNTIIVQIKNEQSYGYWFLYLTHENLNDIIYGSGQPLITGSIIKRLEVSMPPIKEQKAIAKALSDTDALIAALEKLITKKRAIKTATMQQLLTGKTRLPGFGEGKGYKDSELGRIPEDWEVVPISTFASVVSGGTPSRDNGGYWGGDIPWVTTTLISWKAIVQVDEYISESGLFNSAAKWISKGAVLMAMYGQGKTRGKVGLLGIDATINQACAAIEPRNTVDGQYLFYHLLRRLLLQWRSRC